MQFPHEKIDFLKREQNALILQMIKNLPKAELLYDIAILAEKNDYSSSYQDDRVIIKIAKNDTLLSLQNLLDKIEEEVLFNWELDINSCRSSVNLHEYYYTHPEKDFSINIDFTNYNCKTIKTGKLIPETIQICSLFD